MDYFRRKVRLGDVLINDGAITQEQLEKALVLQKEKKKRLGEVLVDGGFTSEEAIANALGRQLGYGVIDLNDITIPEEIIQLVDAEILRKHVMIPFAYSHRDMNMICVAMSDPMNMEAIDDINIVTNLQVEPVVATSRSILVAIDKYYGQKDMLSQLGDLAKEKDKEADAQDDMYDDDINSSPIVQLVKTMIEQGVRQRASDIHIEPLERSVRVRFRIDGALHENQSYPQKLLSAIVARIKIIGGMDISEKRKPQDGRITQIVDHMEYDIRASILPTVYGEKVVLRLTSKTALTREKSQLGLNPEEMAKFDHILANPHGILLVTGPTGSGKSTTLYTALSELNKEDVNIITVEDPVEANLDGINQVQVNNKANLTFASALRSILRQDPDIIMIGEIRDEETASIAVQSAITGHMVVSTLHTNSAASTVTRLADMGLEPYLIADAVVGIIAQRLARRLCLNCKEAVEPSDEERELLGISKEEPVKIFRPRGCNMCDHTGYKGRIGVYEIMEVTPELKRIIATGGSAEEIKNCALTQGMSTLRMSATRYVLDGITSISELVKVSFEE